MLRPSGYDSFDFFPEVKNKTRFGNVLIKEELTYYARTNWGISLYGISLLSRNHIPTLALFGDTIPEKSVTIFSQTLIPSYTYRLVYGDVRVKGSLGVGYSYTLHHHKYAYTPVDDPNFPEPLLTASHGVQGVAFQGHFALEYRISEGVFFMFEQGLLGVRALGYINKLITAKTTAIQHYTKNPDPTVLGRGGQSLSYVGVYTLLGLRFTLSDI